MGSDGQSNLGSYDTVRARDVINSHPDIVLRTLSEVVKVVKHLSYSADSAHLASLGQAALVTCDKISKFSSVTEAQKAGQHNNLNYLLQYTSTVMGQKWGLFSSLLTIAFFYGFVVGDDNTL